MKNDVLASDPVIINATITGVVRIAGGLGRPPATPQQAREIIGLPTCGASG